MPRTTRNLPAQTLCLLAAALICPLLEPVGADELEWIVEEPASVFQPLELESTLDPAEVGTEIPLQRVPSHPEDSFVSNGNEPEGPDLFEFPASEKAINSLDPDFELAASAFQQLSPDVAYNTTNGNYMVVYQLGAGAGGSSIYGHRVSAAGVPIGSSFLILDEAGAEADPRVAYNPTANEFLVVCWSVSGSTTSVLARIVPASGSPTSLVWDPFPTFNNALLPHAAYNPVSAEYVVTAGQGNSDGLLFRRLAAGTGTPQATTASITGGDGVIDAAPAVAVIPSSGDYVVAAERIFSGRRGLALYQFPSALTSVSVLSNFTVGVDIFDPMPVVDAGRNEVFLTFESAENLANTSFDIGIAVVDIATGNPSRLAFVSDPSDDRSPRAVYQAAEDDFLITWYRVGGASPSVLAVEGGTINSLINTTASSLPSATSFPGIAANGPEALMVWAELQTPSRIRGRRLGAAAPVLVVDPTSLDFGSSTTSIVVTLTNAGTGQVPWGISGPAYVTREPGSGTFFDTATTTLGVDRSNLPPGTYNTTLTFLVTGGDDVDVPLTMVVPNNPPVAPSNPTPANGTTDQPLTFTASWSHSDPDVLQNLTADVYLSTSQALVDALDPSALIATGPTSTFGGSFGITGGLGNFTTYYWRIVISDGMASTPGPTWSFTTLRIGTTTLTPIADLINDPTPTFQWSAVAGAASYRLEVATDPNFGNLALLVPGLTGTSYTPPAALGDNEYFWTVLTVAPNGTESLRPSADTFTIDATPPPVPTLIAAPDPTMIPRQTMSWNASAGAESYRIQVSNDNFATTLFDQSGLTGTSFTPSSDLPEGTISWRVLAVDAASNASAFSAADTFVVDVTAPDVPVLGAVPDPTNDPRQTLIWNAVPGAVEYSLLVELAIVPPAADEPEGREQDLGLSIFAGTVSGTSWTPPSDLPEERIVWQVASIDAAGNPSAFSSPDEFTVDLTPPAVPVLNPAADPTNEVRPTLSWSAVAGAVAYRVQVSTDPAFGTTLHDVSTIATSFVPTSDLPEGTIYWRAASRDSAGNDSAFSAADDFFVDSTPPGVPTLNAVTPDPTSNPRPTLSWSAVAGAAEYRLVVSSLGELGGLIDTTVVDTFFTPTFDLPEGSIVWQVASRDALGNESLPSAADTFTVDTTPPAVPVLTPVSDPTNDPRPTLVWSAVSGAANYRVQVATEPGFKVPLFNVVVATTFWTPTSDLPEGQLYWRAASRDALGNQSSFAVADEFTVDTTPPAVPVLTPVSDPTNDPRPTLAWSAVSGAADYRVQVATEPGFKVPLFNVVVATTSWAPTSDLPEGTIYWRVASRDALGNQSSFAAADDFTLDLTAPAVPTLNAVTPDPTSNPRPTLTWNAVADAAEYRLVVSSLGELGGLVDTTVTDTFFTPSFDLPEGSIVWQVASRDALGNESLPSDVDEFTIDTTPPAVPVLIPVSDPTNDPRPTLAWSAVSGAVDYRVQVAAEPSFKVPLFNVVVASTTWIPTSDLPEGTIYWRAASRDALGNQSAFSAADDFTLDASAPAVPTLIAVTPDPTSNPRPLLSWNAVAGAAEYRLVVRVGAGVGSLIDTIVSGTSFLPPADLPDGAIEWQVASRDAQGNESAFSDVDTFSVDTTPPAVPTLTPAADPTADPRPTLAWSAVSDAAGYRVQVATEPGFGTPLFDVVVATTSWAPTSDLPDGLIFWRAASRDALENQSAFSAPDAFTLDSTAPEPPTLVAVTPDPTSERRPELSWSLVADAVAYRLQVATEAGFGTTIIDEVVVVGSFTPGEDLPEGPIFWRVASRDAVGNEGLFSDTDDFVVDATAPLAVAGLRVHWDTSTTWLLEWQPSEAIDFAFYAIYREAAPFTDTTGLTPIDTSITDPAQRTFVDPDPLPDQDGHYAIVAVDTAGNALTTVQSQAAPGSSPIFADGFESGDTSQWSSATP